MRSVCENADDGCEIPSVVAMVVAKRKNFKGSGLGFSFRLGFEFGFGFCVSGVQRIQQSLDGPREIERELDG